MPDGVERRPRYHGRPRVPCLTCQGRLLLLASNNDENRRMNVLPRLNQPDRSPITDSQAELEVRNATSIPSQTVSLVSPPQTKVGDFSASGTRSRPTPHLGEQPVSRRTDVRELRRVGPPQAAIEQAR